METLPDDPRMERTRGVHLPRLAWFGTIVVRGSCVLRG
jgi:hypothetical protein